MNLAVLAPVSGTVVAMAEVPDPVFSAAFVGPGLAIDPVRTAEAEAVAPVEGTIVKFHPHAFVIQTEDGRAVLTHLGLDTVQLGGAGFTLHAAEGDRVAAGQVIVTWPPATVEEGGRSPISPVVALEAGADALTFIASPGDEVAAGETLYQWA